MEEIVQGSLKISIDREDIRARLNFTGGCDFKRPEEILAPLFNDLIVKNYSEVIISFNNLEFMNSSMIPPIVRFIKHMADKGKQVVITYDGDLKWQVNSFRLIHKFVKANKLVSVIIRSS